MEIRAKALDETIRRADQDGQSSQEKSGKDDKLNEVRISQHSAAHHIKTSSLGIHLRQNVKLPPNRRSPVTLAHDTQDKRLARLSEK